MEFKPIYTWPFPQIPFRHYFHHPKLDIFFIENVVHNYNWMKKYCSLFTERHFFFVYCGWNLDSFALQYTKEIFKILNLNKNNFFFLFNSESEQNLFKENGFFGELINHNCWLDENIVKPTPGAPKIYDAVLMARPAPSKRHYLAKNTANLALIAGYGSSYSVPIDYEMPPSIFCSDKDLDSTEVFNILSSSYCGLALSQTEGASFTSSEYLLCGIPVVSTKSTGGRDYWYNDYNSIICEDSPESVAEAVRFFVQNPRDPEIIRSEHIALSQRNREAFIYVLQNIFDRFGIRQNSRSYFNQNFFHKMRNSVEPDFERIFSKSLRTRLFESFLSINSRHPRWVWR